MNPILNTLFLFVFTYFSFSSYAQKNEKETDSLKIADTITKNHDLTAKYFQLKPSPLPPQYLFNFRDTVFETPFERKIIPNIYFDFDKWTIRPESFVMLDSLYAYLIKNPNLIIEISGHTDSRGSNKYSVRLSQRRAQSVSDYLIGKGISPERLISKGYENYEPLILQPGMELCGFKAESGIILNKENIIKNSKDKSTEECLHQINRRIAIMIIAYDYNGN